MRSLIVCLFMAGVVVCLTACPSGHKSFGGSSLASNVSAPADSAEAADVDTSEPETSAAASDVDQQPAESNEVSNEPNRKGVLEVSSENGAWQYSMYTFSGPRGLQGVDMSKTVPLKNKATIRYKHRLSVNEKDARELLPMMVDQSRLAAIQRDGENMRQVAVSRGQDVSTDDWFMIEFDVPQSGGSIDLLVLALPENVLLIQP